MALLTKIVYPDGRITRTIEHTKPRQRTPKRGRRLAKRGPDYYLIEHVPDLHSIQGLAGCATCGGASLGEQMQRKGVAWVRNDRARIVARLVKHTGESESTVGGWVDAAVQACSVPSKQHRAKYPPLPNSPAIPRQPIPFTDTPRLTLMFHVWPRADAWRKHLEKLKPILHRFDRKLLGVATDATTCTLEETVAAFGDGWEVHHAINKPAGKGRMGLREVATYQQMLPQLDRGVNDVTFCAHGKGAQRHTDGADAINWWIDAMYETVLYNIDGVLDAMRGGASIVGSFRKHVGDLGTLHQWHFSGTFYAFRNCVAFSNGVPAYRQKWWGTESWPGDHFPLSASHCIFADHIGDLYKQQPRAELEQWRATHADYR